MRGSSVCFIGRYRHVPRDKGTFSLDFPRGLTCLSVLLIKGYILRITYHRPREEKALSILTEKYIFLAEENSYK